VLPTAGACEAVPLEREYPFRLEVESLVYAKVLRSGSDAAAPKWHLEFAVRTPSGQTLPLGTLEAAGVTARIMVPAGDHVLLVSGGVVEGAPKFVGWDVLLVEERETQSGSGGTINPAQRFRYVESDEGCTEGPAARRPVPGVGSLGLAVAAILGGGRAYQRAAAFQKRT
jgi:hypothetical protein